MTATRKSSSRQARGKPRKQARRKVRQVSIFDKILRAMPVTEAQVQKGLTWGLVAVFILGAYSVSYYSGINERIRTEIAAAVGKAGEYDLVISGVESSDGYTGTVPQMLAAELGHPMVSFAKSVEVADGKVTVQRQTETGFQDVEAPTPCVVSVTAGVVEPRYPSFKGIMAAKSKPVEEVTVGDLGIDASTVGWAGAGQEIVNVEDAPARGAGEIVEDEGEGFQKIVAKLEELKVI